MSATSPPQAPTPQRADPGQAGVAWLIAACGLGFALAARSGVIPSPSGLSPAGMAVMGVACAMAAMWIGELIPVAATALLPVMLFPLLEVSTAREVARAYSNSIILLFLGGFFLARGLERWQVPQSLAWQVARWTSGSPSTLLYGMSGATAFLSMWLSNTATVLIMVTVADAALQGAAGLAENDRAELGRYRIALLLCIAYSANVGGMATPVGTAPNAILLSLFRELEPSATPISFLTWMLAVLPFVLVFLPLMVWLVARHLSPFSPALRLAAPGTAPVALTPSGKRTLGVFGLTVALWLTRVSLDLDVIVVPGWASLLGLEERVDDSTVAMAGALLLFALPVARPADTATSTWRAALRHALSGERLLDWRAANGIPWYLLLLFGGGLALADAFSAAGVSTWLGQQLVWFAGAPTWALVLLLCLGMSLLTEMTSNTATTTLVLPVLFAAADALSLPPLQLMWPAALCASAAFILPISTPPNAIVAGAGPIRPMEMARVGVWLNLVAVGLLTLLTQLWMVPLLGRSW